MDSGYKCLGSITQCVGFLMPSMRIMRVLFLLIATSATSARGCPSAWCVQKWQWPYQLPSKSEKRRADLDEEISPVQPCRHRTKNWQHELVNWPVWRRHSDVWWPVKCHTQQLLTEGYFVAFLIVCISHNEETECHHVPTRPEVAFSLRGDMESTPWLDHDNFDVEKMIPKDVQQHTLAQRLNHFAQSWSEISSIHSAPILGSRVCGHM